MALRRIFLQKISIRLTSSRTKEAFFGVTILFLWWVSTKSGKVTLVIALVTKYKNK